MEIEETRNFTILSFSFELHEEEIPPTESVFSNLLDWVEGSHSHKRKEKEGEERHKSEVVFALKTFFQSLNDKDQLDESLNFIVFIMADSTCHPFQLDIMSSVLTYHKC